MVINHSIEVQEIWAHSRIYLQNQTSLDQKVMFNIIYTFILNNWDDFRLHDTGILVQGSDYLLQFFAISLDNVYSTKRRNIPNAPTTPKFWTDKILKMFCEIARRTRVDTHIISINTKSFTLVRQNRFTFN
jgi:hypothetical protein